MPSPTAELLDKLEHGVFSAGRTPWGMMRSFGVRDADITIKHIIAEHDQRTSLQLHERKDELIVILHDFNSGFITVGDREIRGEGSCVRIPPGVTHRVTGPLYYLEISTYDADDDTVRLEDDYGRVTDQ